MADDVSTWKRHDTWPPLRGKAEDEEGLMDLTTAKSLKLIAKSGATVITGTAVPIAPPEEDAKGNIWNWKYVWAEGDTAVIGTYKAELEITWDNTSSPHKVQTVPNAGTQTLVIEEDQG